MILYSNQGYFFSSLIPGNFIHGFTTKNFGDGRQTNKLQQFLKNNEIKDFNIYVPEQCHGVEIHTVFDKAKGDNPKIIKKTDTLITNTKNVYLTVITADCVPIIYVDNKVNLSAISHQGWKGTLAGLPSKVIKKMVSLGSSLENIVAVIGPSIGECCYHVDLGRFTLFQKTFGPDVIKLNEKKPSLNLTEINYNLLLNSGLKRENIDMALFCTSCQKDKFWSFRRDGGIKGEMISFVGSSL